MIREKKRKANRIIALTLLLLICMCSFAWADDTKGSISLTCTDGSGKTVAGGDAVLYQVATVAPDGESYVLNESFADCKLDFTTLSDKATAQMLVDFIQKNSLKGDKKDFDNSGKLSYASLEQGVYLVLQETPATGYQKLLPFVVTIPIVQNGEYIYEVNASPKMSPVKEVPETTTEEPSTTETTPAETTTAEKPQETTTAEATSTETTIAETTQEESVPETTDPSKKPGDAENDNDSSENIPHTGQTTWPIPVCGVSGALFIIMGLALINLKKENK